MNSDDRATVGFTMFAHSMFHAYELSIPIFVAAWLDTFAVSEATLGLITGVGYALVGLGAVPAGLLSDGRGSTLPMALSMSGMGVGFLMLGVAPNITVIALALVVWGGAASLYHPAGLSLLSRGTHQRGAALAYHGAAGNVGTVVGPLVAILLSSVYGWRVAAVAFVVPAIVGALLVWRVDIDARTADEGDIATDGGDDERETPATVQEFATASRRLFSGAFVIVFGIVMLYGLYYRGILTFLPKILGGFAVFGPVTVFGWTVGSARYVYAGLLLIGVFGQYTGGKLTEKVEPERILTVTFAALAGGALAFVPASHAGAVPLLFVCTALGFFLYLTAPVYQAAIAEHVDSTAHGLSYGYTYLGMFGIGAFGAALAGVTLSYAGPSVLFLTLTAFALLSLLCSALLKFD